MNDNNTKQVIKCLTDYIDYLDNAGYYMKGEEVQAVKSAIKTVNKLESEAAKLREQVKQWADNSEINEGKYIELKEKLATLKAGLSANMESENADWRRANLGRNRNGEGQV